MGGGRAPSQQEQFPLYTDADPTSIPPPLPPSSPPSLVPLGGSSNHASSRGRGRSREEREREREQEYAHTPKDVPAHHPAARCPSSASASNPALGLRAARRGIARAMADLAALKTQTQTLYAAELAARDATLAQVRGFESQRRGLEDAIAGILAPSSPPGGGRDSPAAALKAEEQALSGEIEELEGRLAGLRSRRRGVREAIQRGENRVEARVSSWRGSLRECEREVGRFLERRPGWVKGGEGVWGLPVKRRTLEMVREEVEGERKGLEGRKKGVEREREALVKGGRVWEGVVGEVRGVEDLLREEMGKLEGGESSGGDGGGGGKEGMEKVLEKMAMARGRVEEGLRLAEEKGWNLLLACIGAELEALVEGEAILKGALGLELVSGDDAEGRGDINGAVHGLGSGDVELQRMGRTDGSQGNKDMEELNGIEEEGREEPYYDDEPGPELLFSKGDDEARL